MSTKLVPLILPAALCLLATTAMTQAPAEAKTRKQTQPGNYLVPPPPAYMPSILPELAMDEKAKPKKPKSVVKKHIYFARGYEEPEPVKAHKTVTYWNQKPDPESGIVSYDWSSKP